MKSTNLRFNVGLRKETKNEEFFFFTTEPFVCSCNIKYKAVFLCLCKFVPVGRVPK